MFGLGMGELLVILVVALLVFGPKKLPELASGLGKAIRDFRRATRDLQDQIEIDDEVRKPIQELRAALRDEPAPAPLPSLPRPSGAVAKEPPAAASASAATPTTPAPAVAPSSPGEAKAAEVAQAAPDAAARSDKTDKAPTA